jgi:hypothetical protein
LVGPLLLGEWQSKTSWWELYAGSKPHLLEARNKEKRKGQGPIPFKNMSSVT